ncbi:MAG: hypothetical protein ACXIUP_04740 [Microcella sp.]
MSRPLDRRLARRMRHRSRSLSAASAALLLAGLLGAVAAVLAASAWRSIAPESAPSALSVVPTPTQLVSLADGSAPEWLIVAIVAGLGVLGLAALLAGLTPSIRARRVVQDARGAVLVDDDVIAHHLAARAAADAGVTRSAVSVYTTRRAVALEVTPATGFVPDRQAVQSAADARLDALSPTPSLRARVRVAAAGKVGVS